MSNDLKVGESDFVEIFIPDSNGLSTLIDLEDWDFFRSKRWRIKNSKTKNPNKSKPYLFEYGSYGGNFCNLLLNSNYIIDHKNRNTLDNRRFNLREASRSQNNANVGKYANKSSRFKGVMWHSGRNKWRVQVRKHGICHSGGSFIDEIEAAKKANELILKLHGRFGVLNIVDSI